CVCCRLVCVEDEAGRVAIMVVICFYRSWRKENAFRLVVSHQMNQVHAVVANSLQIARGIQKARKHFSLMLSQGFTRQFNQILCQFLVHTIDGVFYKFRFLSVAVVSCIKKEKGSFKTL